VADAWSLLPGDTGDAWDRLNTPCAGGGDAYYYDSPSIAVAEDEERIVVAEDSTSEVVVVDDVSVMVDIDSEDITVTREDQDVQSISG
jgi:hypothetical protein